eukprot:TRINITY_DN5296_c0_g1_i2.p1 TRINITY_DN5296_c0_g1~~TRINITY_DN5296_c0_g1_i2.p1  ORF type:complete len:172 (-),score=13.72 TRINITY_DN5296_c0_g1_i2:45-500(-)
MEISSYNWKHCLETVSIDEHHTRDKYWSHSVYPNLQNDLPLGKRGRGLVEYPISKVLWCTEFIVTLLNITNFLCKYCFWLLPVVTIVTFLNSDFTSIILLQLLPLKSVQPNMLFAHSTSVLLTSIPIKIFLMFSNNVISSFCRDSLRKVSI